MSEESSSLGLLLKMGGKPHLKLNTGQRPIANKYREGKMKRTLKRELKSAWNCWEGSVWKLRVHLGLCISNELLYVPGAGQNGLSWRDNSRGCYFANAAGLTKAWATPQSFGSASQRFWRKAFKWPVLKHGPRSASCMRVGGWKTHEAQVTWLVGWPVPAPSTNHELLRKVWVRAYLVRPERWWTMPEQGEARGNSGGGS